MPTIVSDHCYHVTTGECLDILGTDAEKGLDQFEIQHRREKFGPNQVTERKGRGPLVRFLLQFHQPLVYILLAAAVIALAFKGAVDAGVILGVVLINAIVGFAQEAKALRSIASLARNLQSLATVIRGGKKQQIPAVELVPGDIVLLQAGDRVPADLRLFATRDLRIDESALTGESVPTEKDPAVLPHGTPLGDRHNLAFSSTLVTYGTGSGVVVATGDATEIGRISELIATSNPLDTPLTRKIHSFSRVLLFAILGLAAVVFVVGVLRGQPVIDILVASIAITVAAIPEGLPAAVTIIMAIGVSRLAERSAIIRRLPAVEALGSTTVICSDKTGTLTQNQMTVQAVMAAGEVYQVSGTGYVPTGEVSLRGAPATLESHPALRECLLGGLLCNDAEIVEKDGTWKVQGDPTEGALLSAAWKAGLTPEDWRARMPRLDSIPFESQYQYMATLHPLQDSPNRIAYLKGSTEKVLERCEKALGPNGPEPLDRDEIMRRVAELAAQGLRVLALARKEFSSGTTALRHEDVREGLLFLGLQAMLDPPRPEAGPAVAACLRAGIRVKMITGDHAVTAAAIASRLGIAGEGGARALTSQDLTGLTDEQFIEAAGATDVFARVTPENKLRLVEALQARGEVVAMTGDGVNDAPALRRADIGIAMALGGTETAREAADMVLTDDNFATIEAAVEEGRGVFDNLQKFIAWTLPTNGGEALVLIAAVLLGIHLPILPIQILWINLSTAVCLGLMLAFEPKEGDLMARPPVPPGSPILSAFLLQRIVLVSSLLCGAVFAVFEWEMSQGASETAARTAAVSAIVFGQLAYLFNSRSLKKSLVSVGIFSNPWAWFGAALMALLQVGFTYLPFMNRLFATEPVRPGAWLIVLSCGLCVFLCVGADKWIRNRLAERRGAIHP
ncbi:MAG: cation-transporting P-type ATPase [Myxococcales bacterium]|nr:cation-transporting P-type ATPase [Myxococcales bacterium]